MPLTDLIIGAQTVSSDLHEICLKRGLGKRGIIYFEEDQIYTTAVILLINMHLTLEITYSHNFSLVVLRATSFTSL